MNIFRKAWKQVIVLFPPIDRHFRVLFIVSKKLCKLDNRINVGVSVGFRLSHTSQIKSVRGGSSFDFDHYLLKRVSERVRELQRQQVARIMKERLVQRVTYLSPDVVIEKVGIQMLKAGGAQPKCTRISVPLDLANPRHNVFSFPVLLAKQQRREARRAEKRKGSSSEVIVLDSESDNDNEAENGDGDENGEERSREDEEREDRDNRSASTSSEESGSESGVDTSDPDIPDAVDGTGNNKEGRKRAKRTDPTNVYDIEDEFIDDSEHLGTEAGGGLADTQFGFFVWRGPVEDFTDHIVFQDFFEATRAPAQKKRRGGPIPRGGVTKKSADASPAKLPTSTALMNPGAASSVLSSSVNPAAGPNTDSAAASKTSGALQTLIEPKKRKRVSAAATPSKKTALTIATNAEGTGGEKGAGTDSSSFGSVPTPKKKKRVGSIGHAADVVGSATSSTVKPEPGESAGAEVADEKGKKKMVALSPAVEVTLNYLKNEREKESFENKKNFPQNLRPPLLEAAKVAVLQDEMNENFIRHVKKILPYNSFTLRRLVARMLLNHAIMQSKINITMKTTEFQNHVNHLCAQQGLNSQFPCSPPSLPEHQVTPGIDGPLESQPDTPAAPAGGGDISTLVPVPEKKKFKFDDESKLAIWNLLVLEWEQAELTNLLNALDGNNSGVKITDANVRKAVYSKMVPFWPTGWMSTNDLSREYSLYKRRVVTRVTAHCTSNNLPPADAATLASMFIADAANMLMPDTREVFRILKAMKALLASPKAEEGGAEKKEGAGADKKEGAVPSMAMETDS
ncbi:hypothetical protein BC830DRAFT_1085656 [Chytriomyces sp. MP71]|nr:hypothetical protein BC830DRAFT_1085656 [Chytriomyces sp. MP71]